MLRLTELKLPLDHGLPAEQTARLRAAVCQRLGMGDADLKMLHVYRRGYDARKRGRSPGAICGPPRDPRARSA